MHQRARLAAFARALGERLHESWKLIPAHDLCGASLGHGEGGRRHAGVAHEPLRHRFVEGDRHGQRVREEIRLVEQLAQRRHLRLPRPSLHAFGDREHEVVALALGEARGKRLPAADTDRLATEGLERARERIDRLDRVELRDRLLGEAEGAIIVAQVVDEGDAHQDASPHGRSAPTVPSGSV